MTDRTRQYGKLDEIRADHLNRYKFALQRVKQVDVNPRFRVLDAACGCGYGSSILNELGRVVGVDISQDAIDYARKNYHGPGYVLGSILEKPWCGVFDVLTSFETIEHLKEPEKALKLFRDSVDGLFFVSVPNESVNPFNADDFAGDEYPHQRHYTPDELDELLSAADFKVIERYCQKDKRPGVVEPGTDGRFLVYVCT